MKILESIQPNTRFHFAIGERNVIHRKFEVADFILFEKKSLLFQAKLAAKADSANKPYFNLVAEWEVHFAGKGLDGYTATEQPFAVTFARSTGIETEFALKTHRVMQNGGR